MLIQTIFYNNPDEYPPIINSIRLMTQTGYRVDILCRDNARAWNVNYPNEAQVRRLKARRNDSWSEYLSFVVSVLRQAHSSARIFVGHDMHGLLPARLLAWRYRRPLIYHCHDFVDRPEALAVGGRIVKAFEQQFAHTADVVIVPDRGRAEVMVEALHLKHPPLIVANAPLIRSWQPGDALQRALALQSKCFERIVFRQGRIGVGHAIEATIRSLPLWNDSTWGFVVMGYGEPDYIDQLVELARSLSVVGRFAVLLPVGYDQVPEFTVGADIGHALYEPIHINNVHITTASNKIMEYMAAGLPLLVSNRPALKEFVERYQCGVAADETSPESIAAAVNTVLAEWERARQLGRAGQAAFERELCYDKQFAPVLECIQALDDQRRRESHSYETK